MQLQLQLQLQRIFLHSIVPIAKNSRKSRSGIEEQISYQKVKEELSYFNFVGSHDTNTQNTKPIWCMIALNEQ
jgi:hypothetical protein